MLFCVNGGPEEGSGSAITMTIVTRGGGSEEVLITITSQNGAMASLDGTVITIPTTREGS